MPMQPSSSPELLYLDGELVVVHKPAGLLVHPTGISRDRVSLLGWTRDRVGRHVYPVHRLDRAASGVIAFGLDREAASRMAAQFREGTVAKRYWAVVRGWPAQAGRIDRELDGKPSLSSYRVLGRAEMPWSAGGHPSSRYSLLEVETGSGRFHQIRRHLAGVSHPILGDTRRGDGVHTRHFRERLGCHRLLLAAVELAMIHPSGGLLRVRSRVAPDFREPARALGWGALVDCHQ
jgi:tRNA pseudouridine65 synthase